MPSTPCGIVVEPNGITVTVTIRRNNASGATVTAYTTENGASAHTLPATITARTVYYLTTPGAYAVSLTSAGVELASPSGQRVVDLNPGSFASVSPIPMDTPGVEEGDPLSLTTGESTQDRRYCSGSATMTSQSLRLSYFVARKTQLVSQIRTLTTTTAAGATPTVARVGLYSVASDGGITLLSGSTNDTAMWAVAATAYTKTLGAAQQVTAGAYYAVGVLCVTGATAPTALALTTNVPSSEYAVAPRLAGVVTSQSDLPASVAVGSISDSNQCVYAVLLP